MRKLWLVVPALLPAFLVAMAFGLMALKASPAEADGGIHEKGWGATPSDCASCHRAHRAQAELLLVEEETALCESCHNSSGMGSDLDVMSGTNLDDGGALRGGGFETARIMTDDPSLRPSPVTIQALPEPGEPVTSEHSVGASGTLWGFGAIGSGAGQADFPIQCGNCHDPHGSGNYRALRTVPAGLLGYGVPAPSWMTKVWNDADNDGIIDSGEDVWLDDEGTKQYTTTDYWPVESYTDRWVDTTDPADYADTETTGRQVGKWCTICHTRYLAPTESHDIDSGDAIFRFRHATDPSTRHASRLNSPVTLSGSCLKCHVAHGSNAIAEGGAGDVEWPDNINPPGSDESDSRLLRMDNRGICQKCHNK